jgi:hypothetical protein
MVRLSQIINIYMYTYQIIKNIQSSFLAGLLALALLATSFLFLEPKIGQAVTSGPFTIKQTITDEISFLVNAANVVATGTLAGITGGTANGTTTAVVATNSYTGYTMSIAYASNGTDNAMVGETSGSQSIHDYPSVGGQPTFNFSTASTSAVFGYTVSASNDTDLDDSFLDDGSTNCNIGAGTYTAGKCWMEPMTSGFQIIDRGTAAVSGATTTIAFKIYVPNNPSPVVVSDTYTATATLTALNQ